MRITLVISSLRMGGAERVLSLMAGYWAAKGWQVTVITYDVAGNDFFQLPPAVTRIGLGLVQDFLNPFQAFRGNVQRVKRLRQAITGSRPHAILSFMDKVNVVTLLACTGLRVPVIVAERTDPRQYHLGRVWSGLRRRLYPRAGAVVVQSDSVRDWARSFLPAGAVYKIPNPVLSPPATSASAATQSPPRPVVAALGRLESEKGFDLLIKAAAPVLGRHPAWTLMILGDGKERGNLEQLAADLGISHRICFQGHVKEPAVLLRQADLFVLPSRTEGFPNALLEAMACGLPVISTDCPSGPREIIRDGVDGVLVPPGDADALAAALDRLMVDPAERQRLAARAPEVLERFGVLRVMEMWESVLKQTMAQK